ncbi:hypothetical protein [Pseudoalteromonas sp. Of7M-16]|uniref:hypothetical protein n=1 Tax=Pseudoalteromonas sp. Of7M-16 TaxID=2917756 RepID=UPI001EF6360E|nr:hypothetical protein [Pseudoalteromonas sp. Of7M-16]MCG7549203.1 hypothetical protein [Pseudoalteromonas sp. Of7M-16]
MRNRRLHKDTISLVKANGEIFTGVLAGVQPEMIVVHNPEMQIEPGDLIHREMSNGTLEIYVVLDPCFKEGRSLLPDRYEISVQKQS